MLSTSTSFGPRSSAWRRLAGICLLLGLAACGDSRPEPATPASASSAPPTLDGQPPSGTVDMGEVQVAYIGNFGGGSGTLTYQGKTYPFEIAGLGVGGIGISKVDAEGEVYRLTDLADFSGAYVEGQYGVVAGDASVGDIWIANEHKVVLHLKAKREGLMLAVGADVIDIHLSE